ncbi:Cof-type HAD-IIB family hydrolase [Fusibacter ferrireducens]|uniref:HAD family phosphatase n=1 Tax=Fusibacter ferrireducens TaxID=2785058 RepID=A0ABR9ZVS4_9FIRM|nr:Cof-type HAD-IIB family hydrolase [Fusibacter ferrireducens]MBF4694005.1 HAD family phosphatase [Fusibacter ferrireducens]
MANKKLIVSDIDGTLLRSDKTISEKTRHKIFDLIEQGHLFAIATGRMHNAGRIVTMDLDYDGFLISCNGAVVKHLKTGEVIQAIEIPKALVKEVVSICHKYDAYFHLYDSDMIYSEKNMNLAHKYAEGMKKLPNAYHFKVAFHSDLMPLVDDVTVYKIGLWSEKPEIFETIMSEIKKIEGLETCKSLETSFDVMAKGVTKATGIEAIRAHYDIPLEDVLAFGDNENDMDMIQYAGVGVAMSNATAELKAVANYIAKSNDEDGLRLALEDLIG